MNRPVIALAIVIVFAAVFFVVRSDILSGPTQTVELSSDNFDAMVTNSSKVAVVDFGADW